MPNSLSVRKTEYTDLPKLLKVYAAARDIMRESGNSKQWAGDYPPEEMLRSDIETGVGNVILDENGEIVGSFAFITGVDPTYIVIEDGEWLNDEPYGTIHRLASDGTTRGILSTALNYGLQFRDNIRIDTHEDNSIMRTILPNYGFKYCGIIHLENGDPRLAYQYVK